MYISNQVILYSVKLALVKYYIILKLLKEQISGICDILKVFYFSCLQYQCMSACMYILYIFPLYAF